jgi:hypothetical protein
MISPHLFVDSLSIIAIEIIYHCHSELVGRGYLVSHIKQPVVYIISRYRNGTIYMDVRIKDGANLLDDSALRVRHDNNKFLSSHEPKDNFISYAGSLMLFLVF